MKNLQKFTISKHIPFMKPLNILSIEYCLNIHRFNMQKERLVKMRRSWS